MPEANPRAASHIPAVHGGPRSADHNLVDFSSSINPLGTPASVRRAYPGCRRHLGRYPDPSYRKLREKIARYAGIDARHISVGNGAVSIIHDFARAFLSKKTPVLVQAPTFSEYESAARLSGAVPRQYGAVSLRDAVGEFIGKMPKDGCTFICNPNNPTGELLCRADIERMIRAAKNKGSILFVDECFIELSTRPKESVIDMTSKYSNLVVLRSLTKSFGLAGIRIGYAASSRRISQILQNIMVPWSVNRMAESLAIAAIDSPDYLEKSRGIIASERKYMHRALLQIRKIYCYKSDANYMLLKTPIESRILASRLVRRGILVRDCTSFYGLDKYHIRIAIKKRAENRLLVHALRDIL